MPSDFNRNIVYTDRFEKKKQKYENRPYIMIVLGTIVFACVTYGFHFVSTIPVTCGLISVNAIVFVLVRLNKFNISRMGQSSRYIENDREFYRIVTSAFTHQESLHILMNMYSFYNIGMALEPAMGTVRYIVLYVNIMVWGGLLSYLVHKKYQPNVLSIGASGTICGLLGVYMAILFGIYGISGLISVWQTIVLLILMTLDKRIDSIGHFTGLFAGLICGAVVVAMYL